MKIIDALSLLQTITVLQETDAARQPRFGYALAYNKRALEPVRDATQQAVKHTEDDEKITAFEQDRVQMLQAVANKDENGEPITLNNQYSISNEADVLPRIVATLGEKYPNIQEILQARELRYNEILQQEQEITLVKISLDQVPELPANVSPTAMDSLMFMIAA